MNELSTAVNKFGGDSNIEELQNSAADTAKKFAKQ